MGRGAYDTTGVPKPQPPSRRRADKPISGSTLSNMSQPPDADRGSGDPSPDFSSIPSSLCTDADDTQENTFWERDIVKDMELLRFSQIFEHEPVRESKTIWHSPSKAMLEEVAVPPLDSETAGSDTEEPGEGELAIEESSRKELGIEELEDKLARELMRFLEAPVPGEDGVSGATKESYRKLE